MKNSPCMRRDPVSGRLRKCLYADPGGCALDERHQRADCPGFVLHPSRERTRSPGRPPIEPNPPSTPAARVERWRAMLAAFQESTGIAVGTPPTLLYQTLEPEDLPPDDADDTVLERWEHEHSDWAIPAIGRREPDWHGRVPDWTIDRERWDGRDPALLAVLRSEAFYQASWKLPPQGSGVPRYPDLKAAAEAWQALRDAARRVAECREEIDARHQAGKGLDTWQPESNDARTRWASAWLPVPGYLSDAATVLANAEAPSGKTIGRPKEGTRDALREIVSVLSTVRCPDGRELTTPELTWLLMLALPERFMYGDELHLRERVQKARAPLPSVRTKPLL